MRIATSGIRLRSIAIALLLFGWLIRDSTTSTSTHTPDLPPWFGDANRPAVRIAGKVIGAPRAMTVHLLLDVPAWAPWKWRQVRTSATGEFDFGPTRAGRYRLFADGNGWLSRVVTIDTMRGPGDRTELFAHEWKSVTAKLEQFGHGAQEYDWENAHRLSTEAIKPWTGPGPLTVGTVVRADGTPAASVGVQPVACAHGSHSLPQGMDIFSTTTAAGGFAFVPYDSLCGLRILMGARTHEVELQYPGSPLLLIRLPAAGHEQHGVFDWGRREYGDPRGAWLRGRVVHEGVPAADVDIGAVVLPQGYTWFYDETRSRADGSFELFVSSERLDRYRVVELYARKTLSDLSGRQVLRVLPGESRNDVLIEIGAGVTVTGTVADEDGRPIAGVRVAAEPYSDRLTSEPSGPDGSFRLEVGPQGRYRLRAIVSDRIEHEPLRGEVLPKVDITKPSGVHTGVRLVVSRNQHRESHGYVTGGYVDLGLESRYRVVTAVGDELEAAGLEVGDEIVSVQQVGADLKEWEQPTTGIVPWGQEVIFTVKRGNKTVLVRATAPLFGSPAH